MSSFACLASTSYTLTLDRAPIIVDRHGDRGKRTNVTAGLTGKRFVIQPTATHDASKLILKFTLLTAAQAETLADILDEGGVLTVRLYTGDTPFSAAYSGEHTIEALIGDHPDADRDGAALSSRLTPHKAEVHLYRL